MKRLLAGIFALGFVALFWAGAKAEDKGAESFSKLNAQTDWPWWRGPMRNGHAHAASKPPVTFSESEKLKWKVKVSGRGHASPVIVGSQIFLSTADEVKKTQSVLAFDKATGKQLWERQLNEGGFPENNHVNNTEATPTIASDGQSLYATFFHHQAIHLSCLDFQGKVLWTINAGTYNPVKYEYGYAPSPALYQDTVIVAAEYDGKSYIAAFQTADGKQRWRINRPNNITFSSPVVAHVGGKDLLLLSGTAMVAAYDPATGKELWVTQATTDATCGTCVWNDSMVFASGGYPDSGTFGISVSPFGARVAWQNNQRCYEQSMILVGDYLYALNSNGVLYCWKASDGTEQWKKRLSGPVSASPVYANGLIYWSNEKGNLYVFEPNPAKLNMVATNQVGVEAFASPAVSGNEIFLRVAQHEGEDRQEYLYCFSAP